ncbi:Hypothetical protein POVN_LOCUS103 [uncultured virus]|nr:Hypothetical protein POVN_LOCUS103 [uncultured virus]
MSGYQTATWVLLSLLVIIILVFIILLATGNLHLGKLPPVPPAPVPPGPTPPGPTPPGPLKPTCGQYSVIPDECTGAKTSSGQTCRISTGVCVAAAPIPEPITAATIGNWFLTHPNQPVTVKAPDLYFGFTITSGKDAVDYPFLEVKDIRYLASGVVDVGVATKHNFQENGNVRQTIEPYKRTDNVAPPLVINRVVVDTYEDTYIGAYSVGKISPPETQDPVVNVTTGLAVWRYNRMGQLDGRIPSLNPP